MSWIGWRHAFRERGLEAFTVVTTWGEKAHLVGPDNVTVCGRGVPDGHPRQRGQVWRWLSPLKKCKSCETLLRSEEDRARAD